MKARESRLWCVDHRDAPPETLKSLLRDCLRRARAENKALFWTARRPHKKWHLDIPGQPLVLTTAQQFEQIVWLPGTDDIQLSPRLVEEQSQLLGMYPTLFHLEGDPDACPSWLAYRELVLGHIERQEKSEFAELLNRLPLERPLRELSYEHHGLKKGLERMPAMLKAARAGQLSSREREQFDLDYFHLLEHHVEREFQALYPLSEFISRQN